MTDRRPPIGRVRSEIRAIGPYLPDWLGLDRARFLRLDRNENTHPVAPEVAQALAEYVHDRGVGSYPEVDRLAGPLGEYCGVAADQVVVTNGSDQAIDLCLRSFLATGDRMVVAQPEFPVFSHVANLIGAKVDGIPFEADLGFPYDRFRVAVASGPQLVVIINPNNPTGTPVDVSYILELATAHPDVPFLVDEAYFEYSGSTVVGAIAEHPNLIVLRTFSKAFAMAGLRLGYVIAHAQIAAEIRKVRNPFDVNELAVVAAEIQLTRVDQVRAQVAEVMDVAKPIVLDFFAECGLPTWTGPANFVLVRPGDCAATVGALRDAGVLVRSMAAPSLAGMFRMSIGTPAEMRTFVDLYRTHVLKRPAEPGRPGGAVQ